MRKVFLLYLLISISSVSAFAQHSDNSGNIKTLNLYQDSLRYLGNKFINDSTETLRLSANAEFIKTLVKALKVPTSYNYPFDSLKSIHILNSPDSRFRILTWDVQFNDGSYRFFGTIQINTGDKLQLYPLIDYSSFIKNAEDTVTNNTKWFGAIYYNIIPIYADQKPYYVLLGWKGNNIHSNKKVIETFSFDRDNKPVFGMPVFEGNNKTRNRVVFEYARQTSMLLKYESEKHLIVFDNLAPPDKKLKDKPETYGPDLSYNGYQFKDGKWAFVDNIDMRNAADGNEGEYIDPKKQAKIDKSTAEKK